MSHGDLVYGFARWKSIILGLMLREIRGRFASGKIGFAWTYLMPMAWIGGLIMFFDYLGHRPAIVASVPYFVATGMLPYVIFRQTITGMTRALGANRALIGYSDIRQSDILFAAAWLELLNSFVLCSLTFLALAMLYGAQPIADLAGFTTGILLAWLLGASFGRFAAIVGVTSDFVARIMPIALRPMFWISGIFFTAAEVPGRLQSFFWFNPLLHSVEQVRAGFFAIGSPGFLDISVPLTASAGFYLISIALQNGIYRVSFGVGAR